MSTIDQCPSTKGKIETEETASDALAASAGRPVARRYWKSPEDFAGDPAFRPFVEREFPAGASELLS